MWPDFMTIAASCLPKFCPRFSSSSSFASFSSFFCNNAGGNFDDLWMNQHEFVERSSSKTRLTGLWWRNAGTVTPLHKPPHPPLVKRRFCARGARCQDKRARDWSRRDKTLWWRLACLFAFASFRRLAQFFSFGSSLFSACCLLKMGPAVRCQGAESNTRG